ncbi:FMN-binding protein [Sulfurimonas sp.]
MIKFNLLIVFCALSLSAQVLLSPFEAMYQNLGENITLSKKNILLKKSEFNAVQNEAHVKLHTKIYRIYTAKKNNKIVAYGVLISRQVRSKNVVALYIIKDSLLKNIEIIAFNEPLEYLTPKEWRSQFKEKSTDAMLHLSRDIPTVTGATLSARALTDASRIAFAVYNQLLKEK